MRKIDAVDRGDRGTDEEAMPQRLLGAQKRLEELSNNFDVRKMAARLEEGDNKEDYYILCGWMGSGCGRVPEGI